MVFPTTEPKPFCILCEESSRWIRAIGQAGRAQTLPTCLQEKLIRTDILADCRIIIEGTSSSTLEGFQINGSVFTSSDSNNTQASRTRLYTASQKAFVMLEVQLPNVLACLEVTRDILLNHPNSQVVILLGEMELQASDHQTLVSAFQEAGASHVFDIWAIGSLFCVAKAFFASKNGG